MPEGFFFYAVENRFRPETNVVSNIFIKFVLINEKSVFV